MRGERHAREFLTCAELFSSQRRNGAKINARFCTGASARNVGTYVFPRECVYKCVCERVCVFSLKREREREQRYAHPNAAASGSWFETLRMYCLSLALVVVLRSSSSSSSSCLVISSADTFLKNLCGGYNQNKSKKKFRFV